MLFSNLYQLSLLTTSLIYKKKMMTSIIITYDSFDSEAMLIVVVHDASHVIWDQKQHQEVDKTLHRKLFTAFCAL